MNNYDPMDRRVHVDMAHETDPDAPDPSIRSSHRLPSGYAHQSPRSLLSRWTCRPSTGARRWARRRSGSERGRLQVLDGTGVR